MKSLTFITGGLSFSLLAAAILFKTMHWPGANVLLVVDLTLFSIFPLFLAKYLHDKEK